jgi:hypothetical protein
MSDFTAADHVTEREPGSWEDCTFASVLETLRISLPNGRSIPATIAEVNRFRASVPLPDNHSGVTIEQTLPTAKRLYGLKDSDYTLTRDWSVLAAALEDPAKACVVTGKMSAVPPNLRRWDTSFTGNHAVAKHGVRVWCDPLAPKDGVYKGETVTLATWKSFTSALNYWQAMIMEGGDMALSMGGVNVTSNKLAVALRPTNLLASPGGERVTSASVGQKFPYLGSDSGYRMLIVRTGIPYSDKVPRDTGLFAANADVNIIDAPVVPSPGGTDTGPAVQAKWETWVETHPK